MLSVTSRSTVSHTGWTWCKRKRKNIMQKVRREGFRAIWVWYGNECAGDGRTAGFLRVCVRSFHRPRSRFTSGAARCEFHSNGSSLSRSRLHNACCDVRVSLQTLHRIEIYVCVLIWMRFVATRERKREILLFWNYGFELKRYSDEWELIDKDKQKLER